MIKSCLKPHEELCENAGPLNQRTAYYFMLLAQENIAGSETLSGPGQARSLQVLEKLPCSVWAVGLPVRIGASLANCRYACRPHFVCTHVTSQLELMFSFELVVSAN